MSQYVLALDQGTTSSRSILFGKDGRIVSSAQQEFPQILPTPGHVEHDPEAIWQTQLETARQALAKAQATAADFGIEMQIYWPSKAAETSSPSPSRSSYRSFIEATPNSVVSDIAPSLQSFSNSLFINRSLIEFPRILNFTITIKKRKTISMK